MNNVLMLWINRYKSYALTLLFYNALLGCTTLFAPPPVRAKLEQARSADSFVDSIGVNTHLYYDNTVYYQKYNEIIKPKLLELGVRHIRDGAVINRNKYYNRLKELGALGIHASLIADPRASTPQQAVEIIKKLGSVVEAVEGPNEYDGYSYADSKWVNTVRSYQQKLYQTVKRDRATAHLPVIGPSLIHDSSFPKLGGLSAFVNYGNMHNYLSGRNPGTGGWGANGYGSIGYNVKNVQKYGGSKSMMSTETGYHNAVNTTSSHVGAPESVSGRYMPRLFLEHFNRRIPRTYSYEFIDLRADPEKNDPDNNFGLLRNNGSPKPAFIALRNLISLLKDPGPRFPSKSLGYRLSGSTTNLYKTLLQKRDGRFYLILWLEVSSYNPDTEQKIAVPSQQVTLTLNTPVRKAITYLPNTSTKAILQYASPKHLTLKVPDHPLVIELTPLTDTVDVVK